jgi:WD40 repeat protein
MKKIKEKKRMLNNDDFFSPEHIEERLESSQSLSLSNGEAPEVADQNVLLLRNLRGIYHAESAENRRSLQRVWERLAEQNEGSETVRPMTTHERRLYLLKPRERTVSSVKSRRQQLPDRSLGALVASLLILLTVGSMLALHRPLPGFGADSPPTPQPAASLRGYPPPGRTLATSPTSPDDFYALAWAPDSKHLAVTTQDKAWTWDLTSGEYTMLARTSIPGARLRALSWSPDGLHLAVGTNPVQVIDPGTGSVPFTLPVHAFWPTVGNDYQAAITALAWSPDSSLLAVAALRSGNGCVVQIWNVSQGLLVNSFESEPSPNGINSISWSSDGAYIASADGQTVQAWEAFTSKVFFKRSITTATNVAWSPRDPSRLAFVSDTTAQVWDVVKNAIIGQYANAANGVLTWSPDGNSLATANGSQVAIWNAQTGAHLYTYAGNAYYVRTLAWSPDGNSLASGESSTARDNVARIWSA